MTEWMYESLRYAATQVLGNNDHEDMEPMLEQKDATCTHQALHYDLIPNQTVALCPDAVQSQSAVKCI